MKQKLKSILAYAFIMLLLIGGSLIIYKNPLLTGFAAGGNNYGLILTSQCSFNPEVYLSWRIKNNGGEEVNYSWVLNNSNQTGVGTAFIGKNYFNTSSIEGENLLIIFVNENEISSKINSKELCESIEESCVEGWTCGNWSDCVDSNQTRECSGLNECNTTVDIPILLQDCNETEQNETEINETEQNETEINETEQNETEINETAEEPPVAAPATASSGGGGGSSTSVEEPGLIIEIEEKEQETLPPVLVVGEEEEEQEKLTEQGVFSIMGNVVRDFLEERKIDYKLGIFGLFLALLLLAFVVILKRRGIKKKNKLESKLK